MPKPRRPSGAGLPVVSRGSFMRSVCRTQDRQCNHKSAVMTSLGRLESINHNSILCVRCVRRISYIDTVRISVILIVANFVRRIRTRLNYVLRPREKFIDCRFEICSFVNFSSREVTITLFADVDRFSNFPVLNDHSKRTVVRRVHAKASFITNSKFVGFNSMSNPFLSIHF